MHDDSTTLPTPPRRLRDKANAEVAATLANLLAKPNDRAVLRRPRRARCQLLEEIDRPALKSLPGEPRQTPSDTSGVLRHSGTF